MIESRLNVELHLTSAQDIAKTKTSEIIVLHTSEGISKRELPNPIQNQITTAFEKKKDQVLTHYTDTSLLIGVATNSDLEDWRTLGGTVFSSLKTQNISSANLTSLSGTPEQNYAFLEGLVLSSYQFDKYFKTPCTYKLELSIVDNVITKELYNELIAVTTAVALSKTMVNEPLNKLDALSFASLGESLAKQFGFETKVLHQDEIKALKMGGLLGVNQGSETPATFNIFTHKPENAINKKPLVLVGKGVMFDTGGYSLKVGGSMLGMKTDMAGGATVLGLISALAMSKTLYYVIGLVPATDNKISANALVVDDIITMMDGTTVEVLNTDAEGRLVLADALTYAKQLDPALVIDLATLTGASAAITGPYGIAMAGNTKDSMSKLMNAGDTVYERLFELPFWKEYESLLKSDVADLKNIGGPVGGATTAGKFLEHFTDYPWIHLDIAGASFFENKVSEYKPKGATAVGVRLLYQFIKNEMANTKS